MAFDDTQRITRASLTDSDAPRGNNGNDVDRPLESRTRPETPFADVLQQRVSRRSVLRGALGAAPILAAPNLMMIASDARAAAGDDAFLADTLSFTPIAQSSADTVVVPEGYTVDIIARWGDSLTPDVEDLDTTTIAEGGLYQPGAADAQAQRFGYNCDAAHFFTLDGRSDRGLLCINHEYTNDDLLFPGFGNPDAFFDGLSEDQRGEAVGVMQNAHGISVVEVERTTGGWRYRRDSRYNRRVTAQTPIEISGPARGHDLLRARLAAGTGQIGQDGTRVMGTLNNCAGGQTPWRTYLAAEENIDQYFANFNDDVLADIAARDPYLARAVRSVAGYISDGPSFRRWERSGRASDARFDLAREPNEILRFGWIVETDPFNPDDVPKKRTAMGRFKHECAAATLTNDRRVAVYSGDDSRLEFVYKFVSDDAVGTDTGKDDDILDRGTLYAARFDSDGNGEWLALVHGRNGLTEANGFRNQADVLAMAREAASQAGATPMDRPEDIEPFNGRVYIAMTKNAKDADNPVARDATNADAANPRLHNTLGHVVEIREDGPDHGATTFTWEIFLLAGDPARGRFIDSEGTMRHFSEAVGEAPVGGLADTTTYFGGYGRAEEVDAFGCPDNLTHDSRHNLWIITDGNPFGHDGTFAVPTTGAARGKLRRFMAGPVDCEVCGCEFNPDETALFLDIQHPGDGGDLTGPTSSWPDGELGNAPKDRNGVIQPRPSLIAVRRTDGGRVGS
ncbi:PhoX family phosphatase [Arhodomonas aquaeolei]|uniref:PhoX family protein n=1 Tax=Arhodomonas aquaeolei TaxID=2369 RepID=UPI0021682BA8|nr:PhoX family phosphatase [Arhodomonas aquaeolei]MCS4502543.1 PhoX family phosphatase [Arhodomonas aquaeolei]